MMVHVADDSGLDGWIPAVFAAKLDVTKGRHQGFGCDEERRIPGF